VKNTSTKTSIKEVKETQGRTDFLVTLEMVAQFFEVNIRTVQKWVKLKKCPKADHGIYDLKAVFQWYIETMAGGSDSQDIEEVKLKYWTWKAEKERIGVELSKRELMPKDEIHGQWALRLAHVKSTMINFSDRLPPLLVGKNRDDIREILKQETRDLLTNYTGKK
jgi:hypothetical protein